MTRFHSTNPLLASFVVSVWVLGYFFGPLVLAPLSEIYGRLPIYLVCGVLFVLANVATALAPSLGTLIFFRFLAGTFGASPIAIGAGTFGDLIKPEHRGSIIAIWTLGPLLGPILGPIAGGYLGQAEGWRWICWVSLSEAMRWCTWTDDTIPGPRDGRRRRQHCYLHLPGGDLSRYTLGTKSSEAAQRNREQELDLRACRCKDETA